MTTKKDQLNQANPNLLPTLLQEARMGDALRAMSVQLAKGAPVAGAAANGHNSGVDVLVLPNDCKAAFIFRCTVRAGGTFDEYTSDGYSGSTPASTHVAVGPNGDICFRHATDAVTDVDVMYLPAKGEVVEFSGPVATGVLTLPADLVARGILMLLEADATAGTITGAKEVLVPLAGGGAGLPATTKAQLTSNKSTVSFNDGTDHVTQAHVTLLVAHKASEDMNQFLEASAT